MSGSDRFTQDLIRFVRERELVVPGQKILVATSGGLDSSVLADALTSVARLLDIEVSLAHVDHRTRGETSAREATWVRVQAERLGIASHSLTVAVPPNGGQAELRALRREALLRLADETGAGAIATAHHADDNAETVLMRAISGTGSRGITGIPARDGLWIRPLLSATRADLEAYARERSLAWVEDPSNARSDYLRNRLRHDVMPKLEAVRQGAVRNLARLADRLETEETEIDAWLATQLDDRSGDAMPLSWLEKWPRPLQRRALGLWLRRVGVGADPSLVEALLQGKDLVHPAGSFLRRSDMLVFNAEREFGETWMTPLAIDVGRRVDLGSSMAWSFLPNSPAKLRACHHAVHLVFRDPSHVKRSPALGIEWAGLPWPLALRPARSGEADVERALKSAGIPKPYWKLWPVLVAAQNLDVVIAVAGVSVLEPFRATGRGRCVFFESYVEERLSAISPP